MSAPTRPTPAAGAPLAPVPPRARGLPVIVALGCLLAILGALVVLASGSGYRVGAWSLDAAAEIMFVGGWIALAGGLLSLLAAALVRPGTGRRGFVLAVLGLVIGLAAFVTAIEWRLRSSSASAIYDVTTDTANPPQFVAVLPLRANAPNAGAYPGDTLAGRQRALYPDITPAELPIPTGAAFRLALAQARHKHWAIVSADSAAGRIEATATTPWFGFRDDIVLRVTPINDHTGVDMRSSSRVTRGDGSENVRRVRDFISSLERSVDAGASP